MLNRAENCSIPGNGCGINMDWNLWFMIIQHIRPNYPVYDLNPEIIESAYYLYEITGKEKYREMALKFYQDILKHCKTDIAFTAVENVETMEKRDYMATYFIAETLKYFYLTFQDNPEVNINDYVFSTEAHNFKKELFDHNEIEIRLGIEK